MVAIKTIFFIPVNNFVYIQPLSLVPVSKVEDRISDAKITKNQVYATFKMLLTSDFAYSETIFAYSESCKTKNNPSPLVVGLTFLRYASTS
jgi:hypothetical protein